MKKVFIVLLILVAVLVLARPAYYFFQIARLIYYGHTQMKAGQNYMDSLTDQDIQVWIKRSIPYMKEYDSNSDGMQDYGLGGKPLPDELAKLKITGVYFWKGSVRYVWVGGMDDTSLIVQRTEGGDFKVIANYNMYSSKVLWPKQEDAP